MQDITMLYKGLGKYNISINVLEEIVSRNRFIELLDCLSRGNSYSLDYYSVNLPNLYDEPGDKDLEYFLKSGVQFWWGEDIWENISDKIFLELLKRCIKIHENDFSDKKKLYQYYIKIKKNFV